MQLFSALLCLSLCFCALKSLLKNLFPLTCGVWFCSVVGEKEKASGTVNIRTRDNKVHGERTVADTVERLVELKRTRSKNAEEDF